MSTALVSLPNRTAFLLYTWFDKGHVRSFQNIIEKAGYRVVRREVDDDPSPRREFDDAVKIETAQIILVFWSEYAALLPHFLSNLDAALFRASSDTGPPIITVQLDPSPLPSSLYRFETIEIDLSGAPNARNSGLEKFKYLLNHSNEISRSTSRMVDVFVGNPPWSNQPNGRARKRTKKRPTKTVRQRTALHLANRAQHESDLLGSQVKTLNQALKLGQLSLFCGAGVSADAGIAAWGDLLARLVHQMVHEMLGSKAGSWTPSVARDYGALTEASPLIMAKHLKNHFQENFPSVVRDALYATKPASGRVIEEIVELARPQRESESLDSIVTFNFDGLVEENLSKAHIVHKAIYSELVNAANDELPIYHVHGYLPRRDVIPEGTQLVFSEDGYHSQFLEPFTWANLIQLQKLTQNVCLFVGISLTDPNMRRLIDVAWRKGRETKTRHYIIWRLPEQQGKVPQQAARALAERDANALGLNVIWVNGFKDIPNILRSIRVGEEQTPSTLDKSKPAGTAAKPSISKRQPSKRNATKTNAKTKSAKKNLQKKRPTTKAKRSR